MPDQVLELAERGRALAPDQRARLVDLLLATLDDSLPAEITDAWDREIERRIAAFNAGEEVAYDLVDVLAEARRMAP